MQKPKIVIYGLGFVGQRLVRLAALKGWEIVAAFNRAGKKSGQDVGLLSGLDKALGVVVQDCDKADYLNLRADIALKIRISLRRRACSTGFRM